MFEHKPVEPTQVDALATTTPPVSDRPTQEELRRRLLAEGFQEDLIEILLRPSEVEMTLYYCPLRGAVTQWVSKDILEDMGES